VREKVSNRFYLQLINPGVSSDAPCASAWVWSGLARTTQFRSLALALKVVSTALIRLSGEAPPRGLCWPGKPIAARGSAG
jgi:hypothetical protein